MSSLKLSPHSLCLVALTSLAPISAAAAGDWPQFRGPDGNGLSSSKNTPLTWSPETGIAWKVEVPGKGWSSPVLSDGKVYLTSAVPDAGGDITLNALCFEQTSGVLVWNIEVFRPDAGQAKQMHKKNSAASPTPIVSDGYVYVHFGHMGTAALDLNGKLVWKQEGLKYKPVHGTGGSPTLVDGLLVFSGDGADDSFVAGLDVKTGAIRWKTQRNPTAKKHFSFSTPQIIQIQNENQIISPGSGFVAAYKPGDGSEIWRVSYGEGYSVVPRPVFAHGLLFLGSGFDTASLYAIRPDGAAGDVTATNVAWTLKKGAPHTPSVVVVGDLLFCVSDAGIATCLDAKTGEVAWTERLGGNFSASPIAAEGRVYFENETGSTYVVKAAGTYELLATNELGERTLASPAPIDGTLFIRGETHLFKITGTAK